MTNEEHEGIGREIRKGLANEARSWLRWALGGAIVGAIALGAAGAFYLGMTGLALGAAVGAVVGGCGAWWLYVQGSSLTS